jgi:hypothetical protein
VRLDNRLVGSGSRSGHAGELRTSPVCCTNKTPIVQPLLNTPVTVMLSSASTNVTKQVLGVLPTGWYGNFSDTVVWRVICWTQSRRRLLSATCLTPSVPAPRISLRASMRPRWQYSFKGKSITFTGYLIQAVIPRCSGMPICMTNLNFLPTLRKLFCPWTRCA